MTNEGCTRDKYVPGTGNRETAPCGSTNNVVECSECGTKVCEECQQDLVIYNLNGKPVCEDCMPLENAAEGVPAPDSYPVWEASPAEPEPQRIVNLTAHPLFHTQTELPAWHDAIAEARELLSKEVR